MYITYISVNISTPLAVTGPDGQLASNIIIPNLPILTGTFAHKSEQPSLCDRLKVELFSRTERTEREKEKEHAETMKGPTP